MRAALIDYFRLLRVAIALARHDVILPGEYHARLPIVAKAIGTVLRILTGGAKGRPGQRLATALEKLGPTYIKLGQFLATRPDVFGVETTSDLSRLKDQLPPFKQSKAREALAAEFGTEEAAQLFPNLSEPIAAASLAQVHRVQHESGAKAVKFLRPQIEAQIKRDLRAIKRGARLVERVNSESRRLKPIAFTQTVADSMLKELDLRIEAGGADEMRALSFETGYFHIPAVDWSRTGLRVLTTEWVEGTPLTNPQALDMPLIDRPALANQITQGFLTHAIKYGVFHADMHEGNMILSPDGRLSLVDFGLIGRIGLNERRFLAEILWGFLRRDYKRVAEVHFEAGYVPADKSVGDFAQALRSVGEPIHGKAAHEVSMGRLLLQLLDFTQTFGMQLRPELVLLQKTMVQVEGVARTIDPHHDIWAAAEPIVKSWVSEHLGPRGLTKLAAEQSRELTQRLMRVPAVFDQFERFLEASTASASPPSARTPGWVWALLCAVTIALLASLLT